MSVKANVHKVVGEIFECSGRDFRLMVDGMYNPWHMVFPDAAPKTVRIEVVY